MYVDPRGPRFGAAITTAVLAAVLVTGSDTASGWLLTGQAIVFAIGALAGLRYAPYGLIYRFLIQPRLAPPTELEAEAPPRFAQGVGLAFAVVGAAGYLTGVTTLGIVATAAALVAAFLNAFFGLCLGCEVYLLARRVIHTSKPTSKGVTA
ncbi:MAG: hypothetical protein QOG53_1778 [Frankiales bacterium]|jgi:hypothetical protein|nr:hypothetical protein [Frankiales bacterium]